jgi:nucleotide-binding universal stress UspA family protein
MIPFQTILFPTDFSEQSREAFHLACSLAKQNDARLIIAHVNDQQYGQHTYGGMLVEVRPDDLPDQLLQSLQALQPPYPEVRTEHVVVEGSPVEKILDLARKRKCDLIVMGTHGRTGLMSLLMGSVAEQVLRQAPCPVVIVRCPGTV